MAADRSLALRPIFPDELPQHDDHVHRRLNSQYKGLALDDVSQCDGSQYPVLANEKTSGLASKCLGMPTQDVASMSIWKAVHVVAMEGGPKDFDVSDQAVWDAAIAGVLNKIEQLDLSATDPETGLPVKDHTYLLHLLRGIRIEHPFQIITENAIVESAYDDSTVLVLGGENGDLVLQKGRIVVSNLQVGGAALACIFSFGTRHVLTGVVASTISKAPPRTSGAPKATGVPDVSAVPARPEERQLARQQPTVAVDGLAVVAKAPKRISRAPRPAPPINPGNYCGQQGKDEQGAASIKMAPALTIDGIVVPADVRENLKPAEQTIQRAVDSLWRGAFPNWLRPNDFTAQAAKFIKEELKATVPSGATFKRYKQKVAPKKTKSP